jgi:hypothetical protein
MMTIDYIVFIFIRVLNNERMVMEQRVLQQSYLHFLHDHKYNTLSYNDIVMVNERHTII